MAQFGLFLLSFFSSVEWAKTWISLIIQLLSQKKGVDNFRQFISISDTQEDGSPC